MKPTVISNASSGATGRNGVTIPINHEYSGQSTTHQQQPEYHAQVHHYTPGEPQVTVCGSPGNLERGQQQQPHSQEQPQIPAHFQDFDFDPDIGIDMLPRTRLGRMTHDPFGDFGSTSHFGFPQFNSLGRRRINPHNDNDFFNRLPSEFRQYIPENFSQRRAGSGVAGNPGIVHSQQLPQQQPQPHFYNTMTQPTLRKVCDAAIQTEDPRGRSEVDHKINTENHNQHGLRNTIDIDIKSPAENNNQSPRSSSAALTEQQNQPQQTPNNGPERPTSPTPQLHQFATKTSPQIHTGSYGGQLPQFNKVYYPPQQQAHPQQKQQTPPPQTPGGSFIRTIPIFVEGRSEPIINNKEIPNQNAPPSVASARGFTPPEEHLNCSKPLNSQQQQRGDIPPQTPHTVDTINKIQDIQRDVLDLMARVEQFSGTRADKEYVYLDEMLTRNLLKLDNIDTNNKESIRLARKEAIKCIQASINVLEAKAEENKKSTQVNDDSSKEEEEQAPMQIALSVPAVEPKATPAVKMDKESTVTTAIELAMEPPKNTIIEVIQLPPPESQKFNEVKIEDCPEDDVHTNSAHNESTPKVEEEHKGNPSETK